MNNRNKKNVLESVAEELKILFAPVREIADNPLALHELLLRIGWNIEEILRADLSGFKAAIDKIDEAVATINEKIRLDNIEDVLNLLDSIKNLLDALSNILDALMSLAANRTSSDIVNVLIRDFLEFHFVEYLIRKSPTIVKVLQVLTLIGDEPTAPLYSNNGDSNSITRFCIIRPTLKLQNLVLLLQDPFEYLKSNYLSNGDLSTKQNAEAFTIKLFRVLQGLTILIGGKALVGFDSAQKHEFNDPTKDSLRRMFTFALPIRPNLDALPIDASNNVDSSIGATIHVVSSDLTDFGNRGAGFEITPFGMINFNQKFGSFLFNFNVEGSTAVFFIGHKKIEFMNSDCTRFKIEMSLTKKYEQNNSFVIGSNDGVRLEIGEIAAKGLINLEINKQEFDLQLEIKEAGFVTETRNADGFIRKILPREGIETFFQLGLGYSNFDGLYFRGSGALDIAIPIHKKIGPVTIDTVFITLKVFNKDIELILTASLGASLGPFAASVERLGLSIPIAFPGDSSGNFGPVNVETPKFQPPQGLGLALNTDIIAGGGFLKIDKENQRYDGVLQFQAAEIGLTAIGLITTRMPDGSKGFSLLISINVFFSPPIQLSFGFTLAAVGGLIGYNRTLNVEALREKLYHGGLDAILFPADPIADAPNIISQMRAVFPPAEDRYVIAPMLKIGWGSPTIIEADIGVFIEMPGPERIVMLGQLAAVLPDKANALVVLHIDVLGVIDFNKKLLAIDARLYDSRILTYAVSGDAALRWCWGERPVFALSIGGFHPRFPKPPGFPVLRNCTVDLSQGNNFQLYCRTYKALTSNTLQFGASIEFYAKKSGVSVEGDLGFDTLIYFNPFSFSIDIHANMVAKYRGHKLAGIHIKVILSGPTPWNARGKVKFEILIWEVSIKFNESWGPTRKISAPAVDPWEDLRKALAEPAAWGSALPQGAGMVESLASLDDEIATVARDAPSPKPIVLHPAGRLEVRQKVLPLGINLDKLGNAPVKEHHRFDIKSITLTQEASGGTETLNLEPVDDYFAPGQFFKLSEDERLSKPSFERMKAGVAAGSDSLAFREFKSKELNYETIPIDESRVSGDHREAPMSWQQAQQKVAGNTARRSSYYSTGSHRFATRNRHHRVQVLEEEYTLVQSANLSVAKDEQAKVIHQSSSRFQAEQALADYVAKHSDKKGKLAVSQIFEVA